MSVVEKILTEIDPINLTVVSKNPEMLERESAVGELKLVPLEPISVERYSEFPELGRFVIEGKKGTTGAGIILEINSQQG